MKTITLATSALAFGLGTAALADDPVSKAAVLNTYANIAEANYTDSLVTAERLQVAVDALLANPSAEALEAAKSAGLAARVPYQQTEVFRFGNAIVDDWEGKVNAWPLDEGLIDYVDPSYGGPTDENEAAVLNVIANTSFTLSGDAVDLLFTSENDFENAQGIIGVWDVSLGYERIAEFSSGGVGPHDVKLLPAGDTLVVANGGIETHPETGRTKLNIPSMRSNLSYIDFGGKVISKLQLEQEHQKNSIRHLAVARDGTVAFAMQWQGDLASDLPLLGTHNGDKGLLQFASAASIRNMNGYLGSVAVNGNAIATTSPRSGKLQIFHSNKLNAEQTVDDVCGVAAANKGFLVTTGHGVAMHTSRQATYLPIAWDNHLVTI